MIVNFLACDCRGMVANLDTSYSFIAKCPLYLLSLSQLWPNVVEQDYTVCMIVEIYRFLALIQESETYLSFIATIDCRFLIL